MFEEPREKSDDYIPEGYVSDDPNAEKLWD